MRWFVRSARFVARFALAMTVSTVLVGLLIDGVTDLDDTTAWTFAFYAGLVGTTGLTTWLTIRGSGAGRHRDPR